MTQKQYDKHAMNKAESQKATTYYPVHVPSAPSSGLSFTAPDSQWVSRKQRPTMFGDEKTRPEGDRPEWGGKAPKELLPESVQAFVDKHVIHLLGENEQGQAFLKELKDKANGFTKEVIPDESTPTA